MKFETSKIVTVLFVVAPAAAAAAPAPLVTDRPDVTESAVVIPGKTVQIETGYSFSDNDEAGVTTRAAGFPVTLLRVGLDGKVELRFEWPGLLGERVETGGTVLETSGAGMPALGAKIRLRSDLALLVDATVPAGSRAFRSDRIEPQMRLAGARGLTDRLGLGWNAGVVSYTSDDLHTHAAGRYSVSLGWSVADRTGVFFEAFGRVPLAGPDPTTASFDTGVTFQTSGNVQLDASIGRGLSDHADDWFVGAGISFRLPR